MYDYDIFNMTRNKNLVLSVYESFFIPHRKAL